MSKRKLPHSILLVCEGENTEPLYFSALVNYMESLEIWKPNIKITISPIPKIDFSETDLEVPFKTPRKRKQLRNPTIRINPIIEPIHKSEPIRFVREAQIGIENNAYDETWAIFDDDNRIYIKEAFELSKENGKEVSIAYSSLCFEVWLLLHFERTLTLFEKSSCREGDTIINCNSGKHEKDCYGTKCILGYLRSKDYFNETTKGKSSMFIVTKESLTIALHNSSWLRNHHLKKSKIDVLDSKPYTNVDILVKRLLNIDIEIIWIEKEEVYFINNIEVLVVLSESEVKLKITNKKTTYLIIGEELSAIENENFEIINFGQKIVLQPDQTETIFFSLENSPKFISLKLDNKKLISEL